jgi:hypothetical protein
MNATDASAKIDVATKPMAEDIAPLVSHCRRCGGERNHDVLADIDRPWDEESAGIYGGDKWSILECRGCQTMTLVHSHWHSEDYTYNESGAMDTVVHRDLYPPSPSRKKPEWGIDRVSAFPFDEQWIPRLLVDIYAALGIKAYALAAMGMRTIVDAVVTLKAADCDNCNFKQKLERLAEKLIITPVQVDILYAAFDAGSAVAHRGYMPSEQDANILLDTTEGFLEQLYITPARTRRQAAAAYDLASRTPHRQKAGSQRSRHTGRLSRLTIPSLPTGAHKPARFQDLQSHRQAHREPQRASYRLPSWRRETCQP